MAYQLVQTEKPVSYAPPVPTGLSPQELARIRAEISKAIRSFWSSPEGQRLRMALSEAARLSGWADFMKNIMRTHKDEMEAEAERIGLGDIYRKIWGKG